MKLISRYSALVTAQCGRRNVLFSITEFCIYFSFHVLYHCFTFSVYEHLVEFVLQHIDPKVTQKSFSRSRVGKSRYLFSRCLTLLLLLVCRLPVTAYVKNCVITSRPSYLSVVVELLVTCIPCWWSRYCFYQHLTVSLLYKCLKTTDHQWRIQDFLKGVRNVGQMMMMMMMMDELTLTWHIVLRLQGHVTDKKESRNSRRVSWWY